MDLMLRQDTARFMMGKYLIDKQIPSEAKKTFGDDGGRNYQQPVS